MALGAKVNVEVLPDCCSRLASTCPQPRARPGKSEQEEGLLRRKRPFDKLRAHRGRDERDRVVGDRTGRFA